MAQDVVDMRNRSIFTDSGSTSHFDTFGHEIKSDGSLHYYTVEDRIDEFNRKSIWLREVLQKGTQTTTIFERRLFFEASHAQIFLPQSNYGDLT